MVETSGLNNVIDEGTDVPRIRFREDKILAFQAISLSSDEETNGRVVEAEG